MQNSIYFFVTYSRKQKVNDDDIEFSVSEKSNLKPVCIFKKESYEGQRFYYDKIYAFEKPKKAKKNYNFIFEIGDEQYIISFEYKGNSFIYDVNLVFGKKIIDIRRNINQAKEYHEKMNFFIEALEQNKEMDAIEELYKDSIELYSKKKIFSFLIALFLKTYEKKDLCSELLNTFKKMCEDPKNSGKNMDRKSFLGDYLEDFKKIASTADKLIEDNKYSTIEFYGIILCYLNSYDYNYFSSIIKVLFKNKPEDLFEILLIYNNHFKNPIKENDFFFYKFINYAIEKKNFEIFERGLNFIKDIETYIKVIEENKEEYFKKYNSKKINEIIRLDNLKFRKINEKSKEDEIVTPSEKGSGEKNNISKKNIKQIEEESRTSIEKKKENKYIFDLLKAIKSIIHFSKENNTFIIYFTNNFWQYTLNYFNEPKQDNILICSKLRELFIDYYELVNKVIAEKDKDYGIIRKDAKTYFETDEFAFLLDQIIKKYIDNNNKELENIEKLAFIVKYNPYYKDKKYANKIDCDIFDSFDLSRIDKEFIEDFKNMNFEIVFKNNINDYIKKIIEKINNISDFEPILQLINIKDIDDKNILLEQLKKRYDNIISNEIGALTNGKLEKAVHVVAKLAIMNYIYGPQDRKLEFINRRIKRKLDKKVIPLILIEIMGLAFNKRNKDNKIEEGEENNIEDQTEDEEEYAKVDFNELKFFIFDEFSKNVNETNDKDNIKNDIENIIKLLDCLEGKKESGKIDAQNIKEKDKENDKKNINEFLAKLMKNNLFSKDDFFSGKQDPRILLLCELYEKKKIKESQEEYYDKIRDLIVKIRDDIEGGIKKSKLEEFLKIDESLVIKRLELIKLVLGGFDPNVKYKELKDKNKEINDEIEKLKYIKENIIIYHKEFYQDTIKRLLDIIKNNQNKKLSDYKAGSIKEIINQIEKNDEEKGGNLKDLADKVFKVKNFLLFNVIYEMKSGIDENKKFDNAFKELENIGELLKKENNIIELNRDYKNIVKKIREKLSNNEERSKEFIKNLIEHYEIKDENLIDELTILFKSKKYEMDIKSIKFFFEYFEKDNVEWNNKLTINQISWEDDFKTIKNDLNHLKETGIYDYTNIKNYNKLFTCLYDKKEAIDFLFSKTSNEILKLKDKIQPTDRTISIKDVLDTEKCVFIINRMKDLKQNSRIFEYIKALSDNVISQFQNYSKIYSSIIELDSDDGFEDNAFDKVNNIIKDATFNILQDEENFLYYNDKEKKNENITMEELIHLKNQIHIKNEKSNEEDTIKQKCKILLFFKDAISKLELINSYMIVLREKGSSLPIKITIKINIPDKEPIIKYYLGEDKKTFEEIRDYLLEVKNKYINQLNIKYKEKENIRFLYGKQFRSMMKHLESNFKIEPFLRYILNDTDNNNTINEGFKVINWHAKDFINLYELYNEDSLDSISAYITTLFTSNNKKSLEDHYDRMKIIPNNKGIHLDACDNNSMEEHIIDLFWNEIGQLPIAQNILITNKETSSEEMQAFFHRAILCNYNTLFVVEINNSISEYQQSIMNSYIDNLLTYRNKKYNEEIKETDKDNVDKEKTDIYLDSSIVFVYDKKNINILQFIKELSKFESKKEKRLSIGGGDLLNSIMNKEKSKDYSSKLENILVFTSDICGLGKSGKIKKTIKDNNQTYFHFSLGGILSKKIIFDKLNNLLNGENGINEILKTENKSYKDIAIHLDLTESKETSIINEFFFSILITKFYTNNENIIYIPKDIHIYIEIPNCFDNYLSKFSILKIFKNDNITIENMPPFNYPPEIINLFDRMLGIKSNEEMEKFVKKHIGVERYSYHQINIFIKLFVSQYSKFKTRLRFVSEDGKDVTEKCIEEFAKCTQYFTNGGFSKLLTGIIRCDKKDPIDKLSEVYENDLNTMKFGTPLVFIIKEKKRYDELYIPTKETKQYQCSKDYLARMKEILNLPYEVESLLSIIEEKDNNYVLTNDNFKKMVLLVYRIIANVPVIIMGDTGCGKTALITKLNQIINNGQSTLEKINIHPGITDDKLCKIMEEVDNKAKNMKDKELWLFFDEMNTCLSLSLLTEIFINRTYNGKKFSDNIRLIGACNPYRKRKGNKEKCGLSRSDDNENELVYLVQPLPQSLLYYVFSFGSINEEDEKRYIHSIIEPLFTKEEKILHEMTRDAISESHKYLKKTYDPSVVSLREIARFKKCIYFFNQYFTTKNNYYTVKNEIEKRNDNIKNNKLRSIICSIYLCYYIRLTDQKIRFNFEAVLRPVLLKLVNNDINYNDEGNNLIKEIKNKDLIDEINTRPEEIIKTFSDFLKIEQDYILNQIELDKGIGKNTLLKENVFLLFLSVVTNIPLIIIGKPGTGKSLSAQLINKSMRGKYSKNKFFQQFPQIIQTYFQGSESTQPEDVEKLFKKAESKMESYKKRCKKEELPIIMALFDELGLAERSESNPLKVLHHKLEYTGKEEGISFVGISNYSLDAAKVNRALVLSVPDLDQQLDDLIETSRNIVESISEKLKNEPIFKIISNTYFTYKNELQFIKELVVYSQYSSIIRIQRGPVPINPEITENSNGVANDDHSILSPTENPEMPNNNKDDSGKNVEREKRPLEVIKETKDFKNLFKKDEKIRKDFHGNRDFYNLIKGIANDLARLGDTNDEEKVPIVIKYIDRNMGGIEYEIDIDFNLKADDIRERLNKIKNYLDDYEYPDTDHKDKKKVNSVFIFKKLYNSMLTKEDPNGELIIDNLKINEYNLNNCINDNIRDINSRYLLLEIKPSLTSLIFQNIKLQNPLKNIILYDGSTFEDDNNKEYRFKIINQIQDDAKEDKLIIIENLNQIHPFLFDLYNMNYIIKDEKKFVRVCLENFSEQLTLVDNNFRIIVFVDKKFVNQCELALLNRFEKIILSFDKLLDNNLKRISNNLIAKLKLKEAIRKYRNNNYSLKDLLINCGEEEIQGLIYYYSKESKKNNNEENEDQQENNNIDEKALEEIVINKIYKILPQDIISILQNTNVIYEKYISNNIFYNYKDYINEENRVYKISIIYTYTSITNRVDGLNEELTFMINEIKSEDGLKNKIEGIKNKNENNKIKKEYNICIKFERANSSKIKFLSNYILKNFEKDKYNYIFIIHINRSFKDNNNTIFYKKIYSLPDINPFINQLFIDDLNGNRNLNLRYLLSNNIRTIFEERNEELKLNEEFNKTLVNTIYKELNQKGLENNIINDYIDDILTYMRDEEGIKDKIIEISYQLIEEDEETNCKEIINNLYRSNYINKYTIDISSCLVEYIKENKFNKNIRQLILLLEDDNIFTTLLQISKNKYKDITRNQVEQIIMQYLDEVVQEIIKKENKEKKDDYKPKFLYNYNVPGLYNFYMSISNYINKNIAPDYFNNEKKLREAKKEDKEKIRDFQDNESDLLEKVNKEISTNKKFNVIKANKIKTDLIFSDYITYYLQKYYNPAGFYNKDDIYHKLIELLLKLRFKKENTNILSIKIIWIESNVNYILRIIQIFEKCLPIFTDENQFFTILNELIFKENENQIKYLTYEKKNPEYKKEVNECYYLILASICYCITSDKITLTELNSNRENNEIEIFQYYYILKDIIKILQSLNDNLNIFLNEMYNIDELIKIIEIFTKRNNNIEKIKEIKDLIRKNSDILQKYADNPVELIEELSNNFEIIYNLIFKEENTENTDKNFYDNLRYILYKEIIKISDINYRSKIFEKLIDSNEMIKNSNDIFQILLEKYVKKDKYLDNINGILNGDDVIIKLIEKNINNSFVLSETLLYFFEKNSINYLINYLNSKKEKDKKKYKYLDEEPLKILKECNDLLNTYMFKPKELGPKLLKETCKLFCLGYIKTYLYIFIRSFDDDKYKSEDYEKSRKKIIDVINGDNSIYKMMRIYIFKILYNNFRIDVFTDEKMVEKYNINDYKDINNLEIKELNNVYKFDIDKTLKEDYYIDSFKIIEKYKKNEFKDKLKPHDYDIEEYGIDNFYALSYNISLANLQMQKSDTNKNFYTNICYPLFKNDQLLFNAIQLFYDSTKYDSMKKRFNINSENIKPLLFGYRYCLNELSYKNTRGIYYPLYNSNNINYLKEQYYPGNDTKYNKVYSNIIHHFKTKPNEGCYVCLCKNQSYRSIKAGFPSYKHLNMRCPKCNEPIGMTEEGFFKKEKKIVKRNEYKRIFRDEKEIDELKKEREKRDKLKEINYMTLEEYKKKYIDKEFEKEKGIFINNNIRNCLDDFKSDQKIVRNLSQISFRILNYILYSHLFFVRLLTNRTREIDIYLPKGNNRPMSWVETLNECWNLLKIELLKENIDSIEKFMSYIFTELFPLLNKEQKINDYQKLITIEDELEKEIQAMIRKFKGESQTNNLQAKKKKEIEDKDSYINLLKETYTANDYKKEDYPFYQYFYYTDYLNKNYINEKLDHMDDSKYPVLKQYLLSEIDKSDKSKYSLNNLNLFNSVLNLISEEYANKLSRDYSEKYKLENEDIYKNNKDLIEKFIKFYNNLEIDNCKLTNGNLLCDFLIVDNKFGNSYKKIYKEFANEQNKKLVNLLENKIEIGIFDHNCKTKINIQQINETEIFTLILPKEVSFIDVLFNSSYRKILDSETFSYKSYKEYEINYDLIEENMTDLLVKNKKLLNDDITSFIYNNEVFGNKVTNLFTSFKENYNQKNILILDKVSIYKFAQENKNIIFIKNMINDFITLIEFLNDLRKQNNNQDNKNNDITETTKIYEVIEKKKDSFKNANFVNMFQNNDSLTIDKTYEILEYYLKLIYEDIKKDLNKYQQKLDEKSIEEIKNIYSKENTIDKENLSHAIRLFITLVLFLEEDKEKKIKSNINNVINYLKAVDLWDKNIYENQDFNSNLNKLKIINAHINQIVDFYDNLGKDIKDDFLDEVEKQIKKENEENDKQNKPDNEDDRKKPKWGRKDEDDDDDENVEKEKVEESESEEETGGKWGVKNKEDDEEDDD